MAKTKNHRTSHPLGSMLVGSFATELENRFAEMNNLLALQGVTTSDPLAIALAGIRRGAKEFVTFDRIVPGATTTAAATPKAATPKAAPAKATAPAASPAASPAAATKVRKAREISEDKLASLQVAGSISEAAPYGTDAEGRPLAPYGVKNDGVPKLRRGRKAAETVEAAAPAPKAKATAKAAPAAAAETVEEATSEEPEVIEEDLDSILEGL